MESRQLETEIRTKLFNNSFTLFNFCDDFFLLFLLFFCSFGYFFLLYFPSSNFILASASLVQSLHDLFMPYTSESLSGYLEFASSIYTCISTSETNESVGIKLKLKKFARFSSSTTSHVADLRCASALIFSPLENHMRSIEGHQR